MNIDCVFFATSMSPPAFSTRAKCAVVLHTFELTTVALLVNDLADSDCKKIKNNNNNYQVCQ